VSLKTKSVNVPASKEYKVTSICGRVFISKLGLVPQTRDAEQRHLPVVVPFFQVPLYPLFPAAILYCTARYGEHEPRTETCGCLMFKSLVLSLQLVKTQGIVLQMLVVQPLYMGSHRVYGAITCQVQITELKGGPTVGP
jgi:hypothetical protein